MGAKLLLFLLEAAGAFALLWLGFDASGVAIPALREAPWFWALMGVLLLIPARHCCLLPTADFDTDGVSDD